MPTQPTLFLIFAKADNNADYAIYGRVHCASGRTKLSTTPESSNRGEVAKPTVQPAREGRALRGHLAVGVER